MRRLTIAAMTFAAGMSLAWAQGTTSPSTTTGSNAQAPAGAAAGNTGSGAAPVGHRQPRRADVPDAMEKAERTPEDRALDRKIKSICRGC